MLLSWQRHLILWNDVAQGHIDVVAATDGRCIALANVEVVLLLDLNVVDHPLLGAV